MSRRRDVDSWRLYGERKRPNEETAPECGAVIARTQRLVTQITKFCQVGARCLVTRCLHDCKSSRSRCQQSRNDLFHLFGFSFSFVVVHEPRDHEELSFCLPLEANGNPVYSDWINLVSLENADQTSWLIGESNGGS